MESAIDLRLPSTPVVTDSEMRDELQRIYNALQILALESSTTRKFIAKATEVITAGDFVAVNGASTVCKASAANNTKPAIAYSEKTLAVGDWGVFTGIGRTSLWSTLTPGARYYLSPTSPGAITAVRPITAGQIVQVIGVAVDAASFLINISLDWIQL